MPEMDGYQLTAAIRAAEADKQRRIPIIALSANALKGEAEHCRAAGMDDYLSKPARLADLKAMLEKWLPVAVNPLPQSLPHGEREDRPFSLRGKGREGGATSAPIPVDVNVLKALVGDDPAVVHDLLQEFRISTEKIVTELHDAYAQGNTAAVGASAHKLKSSARAVGALALGELCAEMEQAGKPGQAEALTALLPRFDVEISAVGNYLDSL